MEDAVQKQTAGEVFLSVVSVAEVRVAVTVGVAAAVEGLIGPEKVWAPS